MTDPELLVDRPRPAVRVTRFFDHPIERVWRAVTEPEHLRTWFPSEVEIDLRPGGAIRFGDFTGDESGGRVIELEAPRWLTFSWGGDELQFELHPEGSGTRFVLTHLFDDRPGAASFATGWEICLSALVAHLDDVEPPSPSRGTERHEELVTRFGLDQPIVTQTDSGWIARFERQLTAPAETAWNVFFGVDQATGRQRSAPAIGEEFHPYAAPEVILGTVTEVDPPRRFAFTTASGEPGDEIRLELTTGTGHGARLILEIRGANPEELNAAIDQWGAGAIAHLARECAGVGS